MPKYTPVTKDRHGQLFWQRFSDYHFAAQIQLVPLVAAELSRAALTLPLAFTRHGDAFMLTAVLSRIPDRNLYVAANGRWLGGYPPAFFRSYPFSLIDNVLHVDESSDLIGTTGNAFFDVAGNLVQPLQETITFLKELEQNHKATEQAATALAKAGVLVEWMPSHKPDTADTAVTLYAVDESRLHALDNQTYLHLRDTRAMSVAYGQMLSMTNIQKFDNLARLGQHIKPTRQAGIDFEDDMIRFS